MQWNNKEIENVKEINVLILCYVYVLRSEYSKTETSETAKRLINMGYFTRKVLHTSVSYSLIVTKTNSLRLLK